MSTNKYYKLSAELLTLPLTPRAMILYAILADRQELSRKTGDKYHDKDGYYIIYTITDICAVLGIGERTAKYALAELEDAGLIERRKQGRTKPQKIYVQDIVKCKKLHLMKCKKLHLMKCKKLHLIIIILTLAILTHHLQRRRQLHTCRSCYAPSTSAPLS